MRTPTTPSNRRAWALTAAGGLVMSVGIAGLGPIAASGSSHREAPLIAGLPQYDTTDVYAFRSPERPKSVTLIANWLPFSEPAGGPNFYAFATDARYNIHVDNDGDAKPEITYRWTFKNHYVTKSTFLAANGPVTSLGDKNLNFYQTYRLEQIKNGRSTVLVRNNRVVPSRIGDATMPNYASLRNAGVRKVGPGGRFRSFAGQAEDPFFLDLRVFDLLYGGDFSEVGDDTLAGFNVNAVALQVPRGVLAKNGRVAKNPVIGVWSTTERRGVNGFRQVSRLGMPLVNEVVIPLKDKDRFNASKPSNDTQFLSYVTKPELPKLIEAVYGVNAPQQPRNDLVSVFLTGVEGLNQPRNVTPSEQLRLNMTTPVTGEPDRLGVIGGDNQGFPNGRRLADDVIDIALQVVEGELVGSPNDLGDGVNANDKAFSNTFPYLALPANGSDPQPHPATVMDAEEQNLVEDLLGFLDNSAVAISLGGIGGGGMLAGALLLVRARRRHLAPAVS
ncbi:MAG TPA: DUF4331 domain-containing protein [Nocardioidaceae bacterium]|nr:DUF4331 domain-containing protein [Nocardioidaceae bacterium]